MNPYEYVDAHQDHFLEQLKELLRIPSISTLSEHKPDIRRAAEWLKTHFESIGMTRAEIFETPGNPMVYAEWIGKPNAPTVLVYGHYDVQPADDAGGLWLTDPFVPEVRDGKLYARGATDDKGQTFVQIKAAQALIISGHMPVNIKFIIEGEEESGSNQVHHFVTKHADMLKADVVLVSDSGMPSLQQPTIVTGLRGMLYTEIEVQGPVQDLHSGMYGGVVHNPAQALAEILAALHDSQGHITVPGFYDRVRVLTDEEREEFNKMPLTPERLQRETGVARSWGEPEYALHERIGLRPTLEINGLVGGWIGEGAKTVLPAKAMAKVSCRLVPDQQPEEILALLREYVAALTPDTVKSTVRLLHHGMWAVVDTDSPYMAAAVRAYEFGFGARPVFVREGGSIPVVGTFQKELNAPVIMMGFGLQDDNLHGPNEKFSLQCFEQGMKTAIHFYKDIGQP